MSTATAVRERPILLSAPMVRAILAGQKTQTRRAINRRIFIEEYASDAPDSIVVGVTNQSDHEFGKKAMEYLPCPYGGIGDHLWVRETLTVLPGVEAVYAADNAVVIGGERFDGRWRTCIPSIHMPRWASRLTLEITDVRVERLQEISAGDCVDEGIRLDVDAESKRPLLRLTGAFPPVDYLPSGFAQRPFDEASFVRAHYASLWDSINSKRGLGWNTHPWVWVVSFRRVGGDDA